MTVGQDYFNWLDTAALTHRELCIEKIDCLAKAENARIIDEIRAEKARLTAYVDTLIAQEKEMEAETARLRRERRDEALSGLQSERDAAIRSSQLLGKAAKDLEESNRLIDELRRLAKAAMASNCGFVTTIPAWQDLQAALLALVEKRVDPVQKEPLIPCPRCGFFHGPDCANPPFSDKQQS